MLRILRSGRKTWGGQTTIAGSPAANLSQRYRRDAASLTVSLLVLAMLVGGTSSPATAVGGAFTDDDQSTHEPNIELVADAAITQGCATGLFCPDDLVTRGQMASFVVRALGYLDDGGGDLFSDDDGTTHETNIDLFAAAGVTLGCGTGLYCPNDPVTRGQMASFIARAFHYDIAPATSDHFTDDTGSTHEANINLLFEAGVTQGCAAGPSSFCPNDPVTRAQMASFLARALKLPWPPDQSDHPDIGPETGDLFGQALAVADFNNDGWDDTAIGIVGENGNQGAVRIVYGTAGGPTGTTQFFTDTDFGETPQQAAFLGTSLAVGDFNDDSYPDLAISANDPAAGDYGRVLMARGGPTGLTPGSEIHRSSASLGAPRAMVAGQFGQGPADDLALGYGAATVNGEGNAGLVEIVYLLATGHATTVYDQDSPGVGGAVEAADNFGAALGAGDLTGDGYDELVIGVPGEDLNIGDDELNVGVIHVFYGSEAGLEVDRGTSPELIDQADIGAINENGDGFGSSIVIGDLTGDGIGDLIVGAKGEDLETPTTVEDRGNVHIIPGSGNGPVGSAAFDLDTIAGTDQPLDDLNKLGLNLAFVAGPHPMVVVPRANEAPSIGVFLLQPDGIDNLPTPIVEPSFDGFSAVASGDVDGDGAGDLVAGSIELPLSGDETTLATGGIAVWLGQADGSLEPWPGGLIQ